MRVTLDVEDREGESFAVVTAPGREVTRRAVRWAGARRLLVAKDEPLTDNDADALATAVETGNASAEDLERYGALLFGAAFGAQTWRALTGAAADARALHLELAIRGRTPAVQALRWEALHDGTAPVAAKGTGNHGQLSVAIVRLIPAAPSPAAQRQWQLSPVTRIPRVLFAVGSRLTDPRVRPGAEFMGIMRHLERRGGAIQPRVLEQATVQTLTEQVELFQPDVLHVIGHGRRDEVEGRVKLQLRPQPSDAAGDEWVTAGQLLGVFAAAGHTPAMVVLSACQTASPEHVNALPFAADLVAGGVPVVVAMAGNIADTACRVFTRALTHAISDGVPVAEAVVKGRRAAFHERPAPSSADWLLPVVFLSSDVAEDARLVDTAAIRAARHRCHVLDLDWEPVFCGRREFITATDRLLNAADELNVLIAHTDDETKSYGGMRLLRELAARTVRAGRLPVLLGPFDEDPPVTREGFAGELGDRLDDMRANLGLAARPEDRLQLAGAARSGPRELAQAIRGAFAALVADLPPDDPVRASPEPRVVLLCHRVDKWDDVLPELFAPGRKLLGPRGLGAGECPVPVILTGADAGDLKKARLERWSGASWVKFAPLGRFRADDDDPEDILAYLWWLLNPEDGPVYAPRRGADRAELNNLLRYAMRDVIYQEVALFGLAKAAISLFTSDTDGDILANYMRAAP